MQYINCSVKPRQMPRQQALGVRPAPSALLSKPVLNLLSVFDRSQQPHIPRQKKTSDFGSGHVELNVCVSLWTRVEKIMTISRGPASRAEHRSTYLVVSNEKNPLGCLHTTGVTRSPCCSPCRALVHVAAHVGSVLSDSTSRSSTLTYTPPVGLDYSWSGLKPRKRWKPGLQLQFCWTNLLSGVSTYWGWRLLWGISLRRLQGNTMDPSWRSAPCTLLSCRWFSIRRDCFIRPFLGFSESGPRPKFS